MNFIKQPGFPLYLQLKKHLLHKILTGEYQPGESILTEAAMCEEYNLSRFPVRQALDELVTEGYLVRTRGRGTVVSMSIPAARVAGRNKILGYISISLVNGICGQILIGLEKGARKHGYSTVVCCSEDDPEEELRCVDRLIDCGVEGLVVFPGSESRMKERMEVFRDKGIYLGVVDRNPNLEGVDYVRSDNKGGAYTAVHHLAMQGFRNVAFVSDKANLSSINERMDGYLKAVDDFNLTSVTHITINDDLSKYSFASYRFFLEKLKEELAVLKNYLPLGIFAINDGVALNCIKILLEEGLNIGSDIGIVGFDNSRECEFAPVPLTSVAQNGLLVGHTAAETAITKIERKTGNIYCSTIPTQLMVRSSCGENTIKGSRR